MPYEIETMETNRVPALFRWAQDEETKSLDTAHLPGQAPGLSLDDRRILNLDGDPDPPGRLSLSPRPWAQHRLRR